MDRNHSNTETRSFGPQRPVKFPPYTLRDIFLDSVARHPDATALAIGTRDWTYDELARQSLTLAAGILDALERVPQRIGVYACRTETAYVGTLASLCAGAAFVPLHPDFPIGRTCRMADLADLDAIIVDPDALPQLPQLLSTLPRKPLIVLPDTDAGSWLPDVVTLDQTALNTFGPLQTLPDVQPDSPAYLLFTSGSTGMPKGVPITHRNVLAFLDINRRRYRLTPDDRLTQLFDPTFDLSVFDLFMAWGSGAGVYPLSPTQLFAAPRFVNQRGITVWFSVPSVARLLMRRGLLTPDSMPGLRWSLFCGETLHAETAAAWQAAAPNATLENLYGPTELTIACSVYRWDPATSPTACINGIAPIGDLYSDLRPLIVDADLRPVAPGETGELCVAGPQTFPGYWRNLDKTREATLFHVEPGEEPQRYYRTGDMVRQLPDGAYVCLGRADQQIKLNGYRIELSEIEAVLRAQTGAAEVAALGWPVENGVPTGIVAFVAGANLRIKALEQALQDRLPRYMHPQAIYIIAEMPLNANGKIDRAALRATLATDHMLTA